MSKVVRNFSKKSGQKNTVAVNVAAPCSCDGKKKPAVGVASNVNVL
jgi:hypothetical protein